MGFPLIQVFMIAARQISRPVADAVLRYGKIHPVFRNKILVPIGKGLVRMTTRLRMRRLGLGEPTTTIQVSEAAALEQASDFVQQLVLFLYSVGVFSGYYFYTKITTPETLKAYEFEEFREETDKVMAELRLRLDLLENAVKKAGVKVPLPPPPPPRVESATSPTTNSQEENSSKAKSRFPWVSSLPVDTASNVVLKGGEEYVVVRCGTSVGIELAERHRNRGVDLVFRKKVLTEPPRWGIVDTAEGCVKMLFG
ncbi:unnamed protein product [Cylicocyclus nassatus]|uniref:Uncharacterized protein n=1 Tax=Cylicocyclus nassatus TaxID=53992 RepID=A0AA36GGD4_CYLNA|nr:unnamed protein product [Cylicocyclus nassatus]